MSLEDLVDRPSLIIIRLKDVSCIFRLDYELNNKTLNDVPCQANAWALIGALLNQSFNFGEIIIIIEQVA
jgi:hypothetical protein